MSINHEEIENRFGYHRATFPKDYDSSEGTLVDHMHELDADGNVATAPLHAAVRKLMIETAEKLVELTGPKPSREQSLMLTALQEAAMWANADIAMDAPLIRE